MTVVLGPMACKACRRLVHWDRVGTAWTLVELTARGPRVHRCPA